MSALGYQSAIPLSQRAGAIFRATFVYKWNCAVRDLRRVPPPSLGVSLMGYSSQDLGPLATAALFRYSPRMPTHPNDAKRLRRFKQRRGGSAAYRNAQRDRSPLERQKYLARKTIENHLKAGKLIRRPCERCGAIAQAHHEDYSKPLEVMWLCPKDHKARHREMLYESA